MATWLINGASPASLNLRIVGGVFATGSKSHVELESIRPCDATEIFAYNAAVTITRDGSPFFKGKVRRIPKVCPAGSAESQGYLIEDGFSDLETTTYQEPWTIGTATVYLPMVVLGLSSAGARIHLGEQIAEAVTYAASVGVPLAMGSTPAGMLLWPSEVTGQSCAQVIRDCLRYHPDWNPWVDHTTTTPTLNVTPRSSATARTVSIVGNCGFDITEESATLPTCVRIVYLTVSTADEEVNRAVFIDKWPLAGADSGPGVLTTPIELAGANMQIQKQQVKTRTIPAIGATTDAKAYLKKKFPALGNVDDASWDVTEWSKAFAAEADEGDDEPPPINPAAERIKGTTLASLPREIVDGNIAEWMRRKVGFVHCSMELDTSGASEEEAKILAAIPRQFTVRATNATSKIYKGVSAFTPAETAPGYVDGVGFVNAIAERYYNTIRDGCRYSGSITVVESDVGATRYHGCKLNLSGGDSAWATMGAPIHTVSWDLQSKKVTLSFGPNPNYSVQDFLEYLKLLNKRPVTWMSTAERTSADIGDGEGPSARKDIVGPRDGPQTITGGGGSSAPPPTGAFFGITTGAVAGAKYLQGGTVSAGSGSDTAANIALTDSSGVPLHSAGTHMYVNALGNGITSDGLLLPGFNLTSASVGYASTVPSNTLPLAAGATGKRCYIDLGVFTATGFLPAGSGNVQISYCPGAFTVTRA